MEVSARSGSEIDARIFVNGIKVDNFENNYRGTRDGINLVVFQPFTNQIYLKKAYDTTTKNSPDIEKLDNDLRYIEVNKPGAIFAVST